MIDPSDFERAVLSLLPDETYDLRGEEKTYIRDIEYTYWDEMSPWEKANTLGLIALKTRLTGFELKIAFQIFQDIYDENYQLMEYLDDWAGNLGDECLEFTIEKNPGAIQMVMEKAKRNYTYFDRFIPIEELKNLLIHDGLKSGFYPNFSPKIYTIDDLRKWV